jgi:hypothetical protein
MTKRYDRTTLPPRLLEKTSFETNQLRLRSITNREYKEHRTAGNFLPLFCCCCCSSKSPSGIRLFLFSQRSRRYHLRNSSFNLLQSKSISSPTLHRRIKNHNSSLRTTYPPFHSTVNAETKLRASSGAAATQSDNRCGTKRRCNFRAADEKSWVIFDRGGISWTKL